MNGPTHELYAKATALLILEHGFAPLARRWLLDGHPEFWTAASLPDQVHEVACDVPAEGLRTELLGHNLASFEHSQPGYRWTQDISLSLAGPLSAAIMAAADMRIVSQLADPQAPLAPLLRPSPMVAAAGVQVGKTLGFFEFPAASEGAQFFADAARSWAFDEDNGTGWRRCAGYALHFVQDACVPHHAWGALFYGHQAWEDALELAWARLWVDTVNGGLVGSELAPAVASELQDLEGAASVAEVCQVNAAWACHRFGQPHDLPECPGDVALRVSVRAIAASIRTCEMMGG